MASITIGAFIQIEKPFSGFVLVIPNQNQNYNTVIKSKSFMRLYTRIKS